MTESPVNENELIENELIEQSQAGDPEAFNRLVEMYQGLAYNLSLRMLGNSMVAQDATQEAFFSAWRAIKSFRGNSLRPWILQIVANACRDQMRVFKRRPAASLDALVQEPAAPSAISSPQDEFLSLELGEQLRNGLALLPHDQRLAIVLHDVQGFSYEEMATIMGTSLGTVKSRLSRGRAQLRDYLIKQGTF